MSSITYSVSAEKISMVNDLKDLVKGFKKFVAFTEKEELFEECLTNWKGESGFRFKKRAKTGKFLEFYFVQNEDKRVDIWFKSINEVRVFFTEKELPEEKLKKCKPTEWAKYHYVINKEELIKKLTPRPSTGGGKRNSETTPKKGATTTR